MTNILNPAQAEAVYSAICALNNVGGSMSSTMETKEGRTIHVAASDFGGVVIGHGLRTIENYKTQAAFAAAYNLN